MVSSGGSTEDIAQPDMAQSQSAGKLETATPAAVPDKSSPTDVATSSAQEPKPESRANREPIAGITAPLAEGPNGYTEVQTPPRAEHQAQLDDKVGDQIQNTIFDIEAMFGATIHYLHLVPAQRLPTMTRHDGSSYDPNPPDVLYPIEVAKMLTAFTTETSGRLASLAASITGRVHSHYGIPAKLISAAMTREDGSTFSEKVRLQYQQEYKKDPAMRHLLQDVGHALDVNLGPPPPHRTAVQVKNGTGPVKKEGTTKEASQVKHNPKSSQPKKPKKTPEEKADAKQKYRKAPRNGVGIYLEATEVDLARTHKTPDGRKLWAAKGIFWPDITIFDEGDSSRVPQGFAKYCKNTHSPWIVLVSGDVGNCNECEHQDFIFVDIYLPPQTRAYFLRRKSAVNDKGLLCETSDDSEDLVPFLQPNSVVGLRIMSHSTFWSMGKTFRRTQFETPPHILRAYGTAEIDKILLKISKSDPDRWLQTRPKDNKPVLTPKFKSGTRKLENGGNLKTTMQKNDSDDLEQTKQFHIQRMQHIWDFSDMTDAAFGKTVGKMVDKVLEYLRDKLLTNAQFDVDEHWLIRKDVDEFVRAGVLSDLLRTVGGEPDTSIQKSTEKGRSAKVTDPDIEEYERQNAYINTAYVNTASPTPKPSGRKRKPTQPVETDFLGRAKRIKNEIAADDDEGVVPAINDGENYFGEEDDLGFMA